MDAPIVVDSRSPYGSAEAADAELLPRLWAIAREAVFAVFAQVPLARMRAAKNLPDPAPPSVQLG